MKPKKEKKPYQSPIPQGEEAQPLAVLRLHWKKIFFITAGVVLLVWSLAVVGDSILGGTGKWVTAQASYAQQPVTIEAQFTIVREETPLAGTDAGVVVMMAEPGMRVGKQRPYALVCQTREEAESIKRQLVLEQRLQWLTDAEEAKTYQALNAEQLGKQVNACFSAFLKALESGNCSGLPQQQEQFLHRATTLEAALGRPVEFTQEIQEAKQQLEDLQAKTDTAKLPGLSTASSGDYYAVTDGLEQQLTPQALLAVNTPQDMQALLQQAPAQQQNTLGKLVTGFQWYIAAVLQGGQAQQLQEGAYYTVAFPQESARQFKMRVEKIRRAGEDTMLVLSCDEKDDTIQCLRSAKANIVMDTVDGLLVPSSALRFFEKGEGQQKHAATGVYIVRAGQLQMREVEVLYQDSSIAVVAWGQQSEAKAVDGDRITIQGSIQSVTRVSESKLLLIGQDLVLTAEALNLTPAIPGGPTTAVTAKRNLYTETIITGDNLTEKRVGDSLILTGEEIAYREQRGASLKIHDTVMVEGRVQDAG